MAEKAEEEEAGTAAASDQENEVPKDADAELERAIAAIRGNKDLPRPPYPTLPNMNGAHAEEAHASLLFSRTKRARRLIISRVSASARPCSSGAHVGKGGGRAGLH